ncbi:hypothetical protein [Deinococcus sp. UR1]|uniref:hypothetical protein n=1 Tax=Deinococcus sp. UR1 TaxID=1704277 RepID=UPI0006DCB16B|nr:hypothetical protein [Deinococcus sp. UR1]PIG98937.1 hypothetical protein AMD26_006705 [Deinococcus sp. UR1]
MPGRPPARDEVTLRGRGGLSVTLFAPRTLPSGTLEADAVYVNGPIPRGRIFRSDTHKYRLPAIPGPAFHFARLTLPEIP